MSCVVFAIGTLFDSFWEPFFLAGFSLQAFTYLGLCRFLEDNKANTPCMPWRCSPSLADISCRKSWLAHSSWANAKLLWVAP